MKKGNTLWRMLVATCSAGILTGLSCDTVPDDNNNDNNTNTSGVTAVRTEISMHPQAMIRAGDDIVVYGTGVSRGVDFVIPSDGDTSGKGIEGSEDLLSFSFAVAERKAFFIDDDFQLTVFDTETLTSETIPVNEIRLKNIPSGQSSIGHIQADGDYCVVICEESEVDDGRIVKVIDASGTAPQVIAFAVNPVDFAEQIEQVAINAATMQVAVEAGGDFYVFDINDPSAAGTLFEAVGAGIGDVQMAFDGERILYADNSGTFNAIVLDLSAGSNSLFMDNPAGTRLALAGGSFGYFLSGNSIGSQLRSAIGETTSGTAAALTPVTSAAIDDFIDGSTTNNGAAGYGSTIAITPDGARWFIAGFESIGSGEYLQTSTGGAFVVVPDPAGGDEFGCPASDVSASVNTVAFKTGEGSNTTVGYVRLD